MCVLPSSSFKMWWVDISDTFLGVAEGVAVSWVAVVFLTERAKMVTVCSMMIFLLATCTCLPLRLVYVMVIY